MSHERFEQYAREELLGTLMAHLASGHTIDAAWLDEFAASVGVDFASIEDAAVRHDVAAHLKGLGLLRGRMVGVLEATTKQKAWEEAGIYRFDRFPEGTYPRLQAMLERPDIRTLTVGSSVIVAESWAERHPQGYRLLQHAVANARRAFARRISIP